MRLTRIELENFRGFGQASFDLTDPSGQKPHMTIVLVGASGSGKTAVLQGLAGFFTALGASNLKSLNNWAVGSSVIGYQAAAHNSEDIRQGTDHFRLRAKWTDGWSLPEEVPLFDCEAYMLPSTQITKSLSRIASLKLQPKAFAFTGDLLFCADNPAAVIKWRTCASLDNQPTGLVVGFDELRLLPRSRLPGPNLDRVIKHRCWGSLAPSDEPLGSMLRFEQLKQWLVNLDYARLKAREANRAPVLWERVVSMLNRLLAPCEFIEVDEHNEIRFRTPSGSVRLESLSSGFRSLFVIAVDLLLRLSLATIDGDPLTQEAVCLIDEIDAHLDPDLQQRVIGDLRAIFPGVQFIVTTHSDIVAGSVSSDQIFALGEE